MLKLTQVSITYHTHKQIESTYFVSSATLSETPFSRSVSSATRICSLVLVCPTNAGMCALAGTVANFTLPRRQWAASGKDSISAHVLRTFWQFFEFFLPFRKRMNWGDRVTPSGENAFDCSSNTERASLQ